MVTTGSENCRWSQRNLEGDHSQLVEKEPPRMLPAPHSTTLRACAKCHYISNGVWAALRATCLESDSSLFSPLFCFLWPHQVGSALNPFLDSKEGKGRRLAWISLGSWEKVRALSWEGTHIPGTGKSARRQEDKEVWLAKRRASCKGNLKYKIELINKM